MVRWLVDWFNLAGYDGCMWCSLFGVTYTRYITYPSYLRPRGGDLVFPHQVRLQGLVLEVGNHNGRSGFWTEQMRCQPYASDLQGLDITLFSRSFFSYFTRENKTSNGHCNDLL